MKLPKVLFGLTGAPDFAFVPTPHEKKSDKGVEFDYNRPLLTMGPSAIMAGIPIDLSYGWRDVEGMGEELFKEKYAGKTVYVAWEHHLAMDMLRGMIKKVLSSGGNIKGELPSGWDNEDYDSIFIMDLKFEKGTVKQMSLRRESQNLDDASSSCPNGNE